MPARREVDAPERILDVAEELAQTRGFNGFSYADIAPKLGVTKASLHYHFPSKADLGRALIGRYRSLFAGALGTISHQTGKALPRLYRYIDLYDTVLRRDRMCLCGMFAAEYATLPSAMQEELREFFSLNERWLADVLDHGRRARELTFKGAATKRAGVLLGALEGVMLVARVYGDAARFRTAARRLVADLADTDRA